MAFGLKNTGTTYQQMVMRMFWDKIGSTMEVYIDDMMVKSKKEGHVEDLIEAFETLKQHKLHLKANKCAFGVEIGRAHV